MLPRRMDSEEAIKAWSGATMVKPLTGGHRNPVLLCRFIGGQDTVLRYSRRSPSALAWEVDLLTSLAVDHHFLVPTPVPATDGRFSVGNGWHMLTYFPGAVLEDRDDPRLAKALEALHTATWGWPQRPGSLGARDLLTHEQGGDVDLSSMPTQLVSQIRAAWSSLPISARCVVHGDAGPGNAVITRDGKCALIDFDEARVDEPVFDTRTTPQARRAQLAWEIATCWHLEPRYAQSLLPHFLTQ